MLSKSSIGLVLILVATTSFAQQGWFWQNPLPQGNTLRSVHFTDANNGWAVGSNGTIIHTTNGGNSWNPQTSGDPNSLLGVHFTDANNGWVVGRYGTVLHTITGGTRVEEDDYPVDLEPNTILLQNYPNPFSPQTTVQYSLGQNSIVALKVYNLLGQEIRVLVDEFQQSGMYSLVWNGRDSSGKKVPSGPYFLRLKAGQHSATRKLSVMR